MLQRPANDFPATTTTITTISTSVTTSTSTTTQTTTSYTSTLSIYPACATNNFADQVNGQRLGGGAYTGSQSYNQDRVDAFSAYDCCVATFQYPGQIGQVFFYLGTGGSCYIEYGAGTQGQNSWQAMFQNGDQFAFTLGNGPVGMFSSTA